LLPVVHCGTHAGKVACHRCPPKTSRDDRKEQYTSIIDLALVVARCKLPHRLPQLLENLTLLWSVGRSPPSPHREGTVAREIARACFTVPFAPGGSLPRRTSSLGFLIRSFTGRFDNPHPTPPRKAGGPCNSIIRQKEFLYPGREDLFLPDHRGRTRAPDWVGGSGALP